jgi:hypothetical protein
MGPQAPCDRVEGGLRGVHADAWRETHQGQEVPRVALVEDVPRKLGSDRRRRREGDEQLSRIDGQDTVEALRRDAHDRYGLPVQVKDLSHGVR